MDKAKVYIKENKERFISELFDLLRIPSISAQSERKPDMQRCAEFLAAALVKAGADRADVLSTEGNPVVYAEKTVDPGAKTVLVYGHYDVMPVDPRDEWRTEPFEPVIRDGRIWGRGADDDKGQLWMHAKAFEAMCATDSLPCNVKFMLEGEEEIGSPSLYGFCEQNKELLKADIILVSDTSMISMQTPSITCGLRGLAYMEVEVTGPDKDLHSGLFGGAVANPANVLARLVAGLVDENGRVTIPGFYDDVRELTPAEREAFNKAPFSLEDYKKSLKIGDVEGEAGYTTLERTGVRPSLDVNGIWGGYTGEGTKTVIPSKASAKISMRLVPNQDYRKISELFEKHFRAIAPESVLRLTMLFHDSGKPETFRYDAQAGFGRFPGHPAVSARIADAALRSLRCDNAARERVVTLVENHEMRTGHGKKDLRRLLAKIGEKNMHDLLLVRRADAAAHAPEAAARLTALADEDERILHEITAERGCLHVKDLAVSGNDLLALGLKPGAAVGETLSRLLDLVLDEEVPNEKGALLAAARKEMQTHE